MEKQWLTQDWTQGESNALVKNLGEELARRIQKGEVRVTAFEEVVKTLFDKHGRRIPEGLTAAVCNPNRDFRLNQPKLNEEADFANRILRLHGCLSINTKVTAVELKSETERLLACVRGNPQIANITNGVYLPVVLPKLVTNDFGAELELYLAGVAASYAKTFSDRKFYNHRQGTLVDAVSVVDGSRHDQLVERMKKGSVVGIHFPNHLQGFSINASREQMPTLPGGFVLSGLDTPIAMVMYPDILARGWNTPGLDLAAFSWQSAADSLSFKAHDGGLAFARTALLALARAHYSGGLLFLG